MDDIITIYPEENFVWDYGAAQPVVSIEFGSAMPLILLEIEDGHPVPN